MESYPHLVFEYIIYSIKYSESLVLNRISRMIKKLLNDASVNHGTSPTTVPEIETLDQKSEALMKILNDATRRKLLFILLLEGPQRVVNLFPRLGVCQSTVSHCFEKLLLEGLVEKQRDGRVVLYSIVETFKPRLRAIIEFLNTAEPA